MTSFLTIVFISGLMLILLFYVSKVIIMYQADTIAETIVTDVHSGNAAKVMGVTSIDMMRMDNPMSKNWIDKLDKTSILNEWFNLSEAEDDIIIVIDMNGEIVFSNETDSDRDFYELYQDTEARKQIYDSNGNIIGNVKVRVNGILVMGIMAGVIIVVILISFAALMVSKAISMLMVIPIINPINQLEKKFKAMAEGDVETAANTQLILKKPLREIESLVDSTNGIMKKLQGYNEILENQKEILENQNSELEMQNEELMQSKQHIQEQQAQLIQSEKMASVGMLTAAITHEINTQLVPLTVMLS